MKNSKKIAILGLLQFTLLLTAGYSQQLGEIGYSDKSNFPIGKEGKVLQSLITTINANDTNKIREFIVEYCSKEFQNMVPMEAHQKFWLDVHKKTGGIDFHSIRSYNPPRPQETVVVVKNRNYDSWEAVTISFAENYIINGLRFSEARTPSNIFEPKIKETDLLNKTKELIEGLCEKDVFSGTVLVAKGEKVLFEKACGEASKRFHVSNNVDTKFNLGSMNKMFTAISIMQLVEKDVVRLNDSISKYVDESWLPREITDKVTVHDLLSHTSGLGSYFNEKYWKTSRGLFRTVEDFKPLVRGDSLAFEPGEKFRYSNTGMLLLGVVIEKATGQDYFDYIREYIYKPSDMFDSDSYEMDQPVENLAIGYISADGNNTGWENNIYKHVIKGGPAGGGFSTVGDLHKFALALINNKLVSQSSLDLLWTDYLKSNYGYGFEIKKSAVGKVVGHGGGFPGLNSKLDIFLDNGYIVVVMSNYDQGASPISQKVYGWIERL